MTRELFLVTRVELPRVTGPYKSDNRTGTSCSNGAGSPRSRTTGLRSDLTHYTPRDCGPGNGDLGQCGTCRLKTTKMFDGA